MNGSPDWYAENIGRDLAPPWSEHQCLSICNACGDVGRVVVFIGTDEFGQSDRAQCEHGHDLDPSEFQDVCDRQYKLQRQRLEAIAEADL